MSKPIGAWALKLGLLAVLLCVGTGSAFADLSFNIAGSTTGDFYYPLPLGLGSINQGNSVGGMTFAGVSNFSTNKTSILLGTFDANSVWTSFDPYTFKLNVNFTAPAVAGTSFNAEMDGLVTFLGGSATIDFTDNGPRHFAFSGSQGSGAFDLTITKVVTVSDAKDGQIWGTISNATFAATPEPAAVVLTSALFGGLLLLFRKKLKSC